MVADDHVAPVDGLHQLAELVLSLPGDLQRAVGDKGFKEIELCAHQLRRQTHRYRSFQKSVSINLYSIALTGIFVNTRKCAGGGFPSPARLGLWG